VRAKAVTFRRVSCETALQGLRFLLLWANAAVPSFQFGKNHRTHTSLCECSRLRPSGQIPSSVGNVPVQPNGAGDNITPRNHRVNDNLQILTSPPNRMVDLLICNADVINTAPQ
jgi:hypothetical protein